MVRGIRGTGAKTKAIFENCNIKNASIISNTDGYKVDLKRAPRVEYQESMFTDTIDVSMIVINSSNRVRGKNFMEGLPLVGTEDFFLAIEDANGNVIETELVVMGAKIALTNYKLPFDPSKLKSFDRFHKKFGKYVITAMESK